MYRRARGRCCRRRRRRSRLPLYAFLLAVLSFTLAFTLPPEEKEQQPDRIAAVKPVGVPVGAVSGPSPGRSRRKRLEPDPGQSPKPPAGGLYPAGKSGITGIIYEPWHYRYVGREAAAAVHGQGVCLEEYLGT